jgi:hypothetical protein
VAGGERVGDGLQRELHRDGLAGHERLRAVVAVAVAQVEDAARDEGGGAVRRDVAQARDDERGRPVGGEVQPQPRDAEQLHGLLERRGVEGQRPCVLSALVCRQVGRVAVRQPGAGVGADGERAGVP